MPDLRNDDAAREDRVDEVIASYLEAVERGESPDARAYIAQHPDIASELSLFFADRAEFQQMAGELSPAAEGEQGWTGSLANKPPSDPNEPTWATRNDRPTSCKAAWRRYLGDYELLEEIARGGMGVVYKARQVTLNRIVALKMILAGQLASAEDVKRFRIEAEAAASSTIRISCRSTKWASTTGNTISRWDTSMGRAWRHAWPRDPCRRARPPSWSRPWPRRSSMPTKRA